MYATLVREFHLTLTEVLDLTPRQIQEIYFHNPDGASTPASGGSRLHQMLALIEGGIVKATPEQLAELKRRVDDS